MCRDIECKPCKYGENLKGCAAKHVGKARRLIAKRDQEGAARQLSYFARARLLDWE